MTIKEPTPQVKVITNRQEMEAYLNQYLDNLEDGGPVFNSSAIINEVLTQEGWYYVSDSPCTCSHGAHEGHNLTCGYYYKGIVE